MAIDLEQELNAWMDENQTELFDLIREAMAEFEEKHPGMDDAMVKLNALSMADRRFLSRALGQVLGKYLPQQS
jgi:hypothetical protein